MNSCVQREPDILEKIWCCRILTKPFHESDISLTPNKIVFFSRKRKYLTQTKKRGNVIPYFSWSPLPSPPPPPSPSALPLPLPLRPPPPPLLLLPSTTVLMNYNSPTPNSFEKCFRMFFLSIFTMLCTSSCFKTSEEFKLHRVGLVFQHGCPFIVLGLSHENTLCANNITPLNVIP